MYLIMKGRRIMLRDVQNDRDNRNIDIDQVGIEDLEYPIEVMDKSNKVQSTIAKIKMVVNLPRFYRGTHMSRFVEIIHDFKGLISINTIQQIVETMQDKFMANRAYIELAFPYFIEKKAPISQKASLLSYECKFIASLIDDFDLIVQVTVPIHSLCPCSKEISKYGAHNQRGEVILQVRTNKLVWIEELIKIVEKKASAEIYSLLKREDEQFITEQAYENPRFVEDLVREIALHLNNDERIDWYKIMAKNFESIHKHNAFACLEKWKEY